MEKIVIALNLIIDYIESEKFINQNEIENMLYDVGFDDHEIRQALSILDFESFNTNPIFRVFTKKEMNKLSEKSLQFIQKLYLYGILDLDTIEEILEKLMGSKGNKIQVEHIKQLIVLTILEKKNFFEDETILLEELSE
ncbi:MAG: DUF494 domain-containing protein [Deferribacterales bacterium]